MRFDYIGKVVSNNYFIGIKDDLAHECVYDLLTDFSSTLYTTTINKEKSVGEVSRDVIAEMPKSN